MSRIDAYVGWDSSKRYTRKGKLYRHACWRADIRGYDNAGAQAWRVRKRFNDYDEACRFAGFYRPDLY